MMENTQAEKALGLELPTRKVESFHYTDLRRMLDTLPNEVEGTNEQESYEPAIKTHLVSFKDGKLANEPNLPKGVSFTSSVAKPTSTDINDAIVS